MGVEGIFLVAGLGNPGGKYERTRHNIGFMVIDELAERYSVSLDKNRFNTKFGKGKIEGLDVILAKPMAYMNRSGLPVRSVAEYYGVKSDHLVVVHDDIDLTFGRIKLKEKGGHGGHNGIRSLMDAFGNGNFSRIRVGVGRPQSQSGVVGHVLGRFSPEETATLQDVVAMAGEAAFTIMKDGVKVGMNRYNGLNT